MGPLHQNAHSPKSSLLQQPTPSGQPKSWERRPGGARPRARLRRGAAARRRSPAQLRGDRANRAELTPAALAAPPRTHSPPRRGLVTAPAAPCSPVSLRSHLAAAVADCVVEREGTHICVPPRQIGKMRCLFACSVGGLFFYPKTLYVTHFGFGYGDGSAVGDSLIVVCVCVWVGAKILCHPLVTSSADKFRCSPLLTSPKQVANILYTLLCCEFEKNIYDFCT